ncbi:MAG: TonB-dependent receptor [Bacteroidetes bacterium]|nr:TonB-dependent receptor [Bacteroidota bacterium]
MRRLNSKCLFVAMAATITISASAQNSTTVSGSVKNAKSKELVSAVSVTVKGSSVGTFTDDKGTFRFSSIKNYPVTLVFSSVGFANKEVTVNAAKTGVEVSLEPSFTLGNEVVVSASRVPERILESPVSIERVSTATIRNTAATNYYDILTNLKGVDVVAASLTFKSVGTRGFNSSGNTRLNQLIDGMDNQAPGLNFSVGSVIGLSELDVDNMELLPGASSALYGPGGMNGTVLINSKNPFKYQGLSFQIKQGINHVDAAQRPTSAYNDWAVRWAKKVNDKFAYKITAENMTAQDWLANQSNNYSRGTGSPNGITIPGWRDIDPNYDGVNFYGDETSQSLTSIANAVIAATGLPAANVSAFNSWLATNPAATLANYNAFLTAVGAGGLVSAGVSPILYGASPSRNLFGSQMVSRTGYAESDVLDPTTSNFKLTGSLNYMLTDKVEASFSANFGTGNTVYTGSDRYSLRDLKMAQFKFELKHKNWYIRAYATHENSGNSFNGTIATRTFNEAWKPSSAWYPQYMAAYVSAITTPGVNSYFAHNAARTFADQGRPTGFIGNHPLFQSIVRTPIGKKVAGMNGLEGGQFMDKSRLNVVDAQYNLTEALGLAKSGTDFLVGFNTKQYQLNSEGTIFADTLGAININEFGAYGQLSQKLFKEIVKVTISGRYDKNTNFAGRFTPRASAVIKLKQDHNIRLSYQTAYRFPTTQNQWINLLVGGGTRLMGGLPQLRDYYNFSGNPGFTLASVQAFGASAAAGAPNPTLLKAQNFGEFKPESSTSFEVGYKGLFGKMLLIDAYMYNSRYQNFISGVTVIQSRGSYNPMNLLFESSRIAYSISTNAPGEVTVKGWGASADFLLPKNFTIGANLYSDEIGNLPAGFVSYFNTSKYRANLTFANSGFGTNNRYGFNLVYRTVSDFFYEGTFGTGQMPGYKTLDGQISYKFPAIKSMVKVGGTNLLNKYYRTGWGNPSIGGLYYVSFAYNVF